MKAHADTLISMINTLKSFEKQLSAITASNREQIGKADDLREAAQAIKNGSFS